MSPADAANEWAAVCAAFGEANLPDFEGYGRLNALMATVVAGASPACAALFAGWRTLPTPGADAPKALAQHLLNSLRELRGGLHGGALLATGLTPLEAVAFSSPYMAAIFGWDAETLPDGAAFKERWKAAEAATNVAMGVPLSVLTETELAEFVEGEIAQNPLLEKQPNEHETDAPEPAAKEASDNVQDDFDSGWTGNEAEAPPGSGKFDAG